MTSLRRAGARWRVLVHDWAGRDNEIRTLYGQAHDISSDPRAPEKAERVAAALRRINPAARPLPDHLKTEHVVLAGTEFDELVVGSWIHLEQMDTGRWWMNVGGVTVVIGADRDGRPKSVDVYGPGDYGERVPGVRYGLAWGGTQHD